LEPYVYVYFFLNGIANATCYFLLAAGLSLIFGLLRVFNLAHGAFFMIGAYASLQVIRWTGNFWLSILVAPIVVAAVGAITELFLLRYTYRRIDVNFQLLLTFGLILIIEGTIKMIWGPDWYWFDEPKSLMGAIPIMGGGYPVYNVFYVGVGLSIFIGLLIFLQKTRYGKKIIAASSNRELATGLGINVPRLYTVVFAIGCWLAGLMGVFHGPLVNLNLHMGHEYAMNAFAVIVIGGLGSIRGAYIGSLILGQLEAFGILYVPFFERIFMYGLMMGVLVWRPRGLFGELMT